MTESTFFPSDGGAISPKLINSTINYLLQSITRLAEGLPTPKWAYRVISIPIQLSMAHGGTVVDGPYKANIITIRSTYRVVTPLTKLNLKNPQLVNLLSVSDQSGNLFHDDAPSCLTLYGLLHSHRSTVLVGGQ